MNRGLCLFLCIAWAVLPAVAPGAPPPATPTNRALLIGCTRYPSLKPEYQLAGPANDVALLRDLLVTKFRFSAKNIVTLTEAAGGGQRPTRGNIEREFRRLADIAQAGDQVVILLAGHGSQQPADTDIRDNYEPDGLDETFLPSDIGPWEKGKARVANAIVDDELRGWLTAIRKKGARLWVIIDACHSGTMVRGSDQEKSRRVPLDILIPHEVSEPARLQALRKMPHGPDRNRGTETSGSLLKLTEDAADLVAIYAALPDELEQEKLLPFDGADRRMYGLLTYTLCQVLTQAQSPITYTELVQQIQDQYVQWGRHSPTPLVEGKDRHREVLGMTEWPDRSRILLNRTEDNGWRINAGALHGVTTGSVFAVYPAPGQKATDRPLGHVRVTEARMLTASVQPCTYAKIPLVADLPSPGRCEVAFVDYSLRRLRIALDGDLPPGSPEAVVTTRKQAEKALDRLSQDRTSLVERTERSRADWVVRAERDGLFLVPAQSVGRVGGLDAAPVFGPVPVGEKAEPWLEERLGRIARAASLLRIATQTDPAGVRRNLAPQVEVELLLYRDEADTGGSPLKSASGAPTLKDGQIIAFQLTNRSRFSIDVSLLFLDSGYGIKPYFPEPGTTGENRLKPKQSITTPRARIRSGLPGLDHLVIIAVRAQGPPADFSWISQPSMERARAAGSEESGTRSPLHALFQQALFAEGGVRGGLDVAIDDHATRLMSWRSRKRAP